MPTDEVAGLETSAGLTRRQVIERTALGVAAGAVAAGRWPELQGPQVTQRRPSAAAICESR